MRLDAYLRDRNISPAAFAALVGVPASTITRLLRGERDPRMDTIRKIVDATEGAVTANDFMPTDPVDAAARAAVEGEAA